MDTFVRIIAEREENKGVELTGGGDPERGRLTVDSSKLKTKTIRNLVRMNSQTKGGGELGLILIESAEGAGAESEGGSHVQDVQGTCAEKPGLCSSDTPGVRECDGGNGHDADRTCMDILRKRKQNGFLF